MADDPLDAALKKIRDRAAIAYTSPARLAEFGADIPRLLAAVDEVLRLLAEAAPAASAPPADCTFSCASGPCGCSGTWRTLTWDLSPAAVRDAILAALTGRKG